METERSFNYYHEAFECALEYGRIFGDREYCEKDAPICRDCFDTALTWMMKACGVEWKDMTHDNWFKPAIYAVLFYLYGQHGDIFPIPGDACLIVPFTLVQIWHENRCKVTLSDLVGTYTFYRKRVFVSDVIDYNFGYKNETKAYNDMKWFYKFIRKATVNYNPSTE